MNEKNVVQHFLFIYDRKDDRLMSIKEYGYDVDSAVVDYRAAEMFYRDEQWVDIVLIGSDSLDTIRKTHSTYFQGESRKSMLQSLADSL